MPWVLAMDWVDTLFLHWRVDAGALRTGVPRDLQIEEFDGSAWVGIVAFSIAGARPRGVPRALAWPAFPEINVRTYVNDGRRAGVWFYSLDAASRFATLLGRKGVGLAYHTASIRTEGGARDAVAYELRRTQPGTPAAELSTHAAALGDERVAAPSTLEHFLIERLSFFTTRGGRTMRGDVAHEPWPIRDAAASCERNTLLHAAGIAADGDPAIAHLSRGVHTRAWPLR